MSSLALKNAVSSSPAIVYEDIVEPADVLAADSHYIIRIAANASEVTAALRLRYEVFNRELGVEPTSNDSLDRDQFDLRCKHLIAIDRTTGRIVGTYRVNSIAANEGIEKFYSHAEFSLETLPECVTRNGIEIGRACVASSHRNSKALFLLWKGLARYIIGLNKRYIFGCCSIFTRDISVGGKAYLQLTAADHVSRDMFVTPRMGIDATGITDTTDVVRLPPLFEMYLKMGAKVCGEPIYDAAFGSIDFFVVLDVAALDDRYKRLFFR